MEAFYDEDISIDDVVDSTFLEQQLGGGLDDWKDLDPFLDSPIKVQQEQRWKKVLLLEEESELEPEETKESVARLQKGSWAYSAVEKQIQQFVKDEEERLRKEGERLKKEEERLKKEAERLVREEESRKRNEKLQALFQSTTVSKEPPTFSTKETPPVNISTSASVKTKFRDMFSRSPKREDAIPTNVSGVPHIQISKETGDIPSALSKAKANGLYNSSPPARRSWDPEAAIKKDSDISEQQQSEDLRMLRYRASSFSGKSSLPRPPPIFVEGKTPPESPSKEPNKSDNETHKNRNRSGSITLSAYVRSPAGLEKRSINAVTNMEIKETTSEKTTKEVILEKFSNGDVTKEVALEQLAAIISDEKKKEFLMKPKAQSFSARQTQRLPIPGFNSPDSVDNTKAKDIDTILARIHGDKPVIVSTKESTVVGTHTHISHSRSLSVDKLYETNETDSPIPTIMRQHSDNSLNVHEQGNPENALSPKVFRRSLTLQSITAKNLAQRKQSREKHKSIDAILRGLAVEKRKDDRIDQILKRTTLLSESQISKRSS